MLMSLITYTIIRKFKWGDEYLFIIASMLVTLGVAMLIRINYTIGITQIIWYALGIVTFVISFLVFRYINFWKNLQWFFYTLAIALFVLTLLFGTEAYGAKRWIHIGNFSMQPLELAKILYALFLGAYFSKQNKRTYFGVQERFWVAGAVYVFCVLLVLQREWGTTILSFSTFIILMFIYGAHWKMLIVNLIGLVAVAYYAAFNVSHVTIRVANWIDPFVDYSGRGFQTVQSLIAMANGGFFGTGIGLGSPHFVPARHTDFIFSVIVEELGILGGSAVILLFFILVYRGFKIALAARGFEKCVATIITVMFGLQTFIILGGVVNLIPLTGITLPFVSYGGSSLITTFISFGILQAISADAASG